MIGSGYSERIHAKLIRQAMQRFDQMMGLCCIFQQLPAGFKLDDGSQRGVCGLRKDQQSTHRKDFPAATRVISPACWKHKRHPPLQKREIKSAFYVG